MGKYIIKAFFDVGGLSCLWSCNEEAEAEWGYNILEGFPISDGLKALILSAQNDFEEILDYKTWKAKAGEKEKCAQLDNKCREIISRLDNELGDEFKIVDDLRVECSIVDDLGVGCSPGPTLPEKFWVWFVLFFSIIGGLITLLFGFRAGIGGSVVRDVNLRVILGAYTLLPGVFVLIFCVSLKKDMILRKILGKGRKK